MLPTACELTDERSVGKTEFGVRNRKYLENNAGAQEQMKSFFGPHL